MADVMLTTVDNPYNPFDEFEKWYIWDELNAVDRPSCCRILAASCPSSPSLSEKENELAAEKAILQIIFNDPTQIFTVATPEAILKPNENEKKIEKSEENE